MGISGIPRYVALAKALMVFLGKLIFPPPCTKIPGPCKVILFVSTIPFYSTRSTQCMVMCF